MEGGGSTRTLRPGTTRELKDAAKTKIGEDSFCYNAAKLWNTAKKHIKVFETLTLAKRAIQEYCKIS